MKKISLTLLMISNTLAYSDQKKIDPSKKYIVVSIAKQHPKKTFLGVMLTASGGGIAYQNHNNNPELRNTGIGLSTLGVALLSYSTYQYLNSDEHHETITTSSIDKSLISKLEANKPAPYALLQKVLLENPKFEEEPTIYRPEIKEKTPYEYIFRRTSETDISTLGQW